MCVTSNELTLTAQHDEIKRHFDMRQKKYREFWWQLLLYFKNFEQSWNEVLNDFKYAFTVDD